MKTKLLLITIALGSLASAADQSNLIRLYEEEILAHDLYVELGKAYPDVRPFQNIPQSEAQHREMMAEILKQEGIALPVAPSGKRFVTKGLDRTYRQWLKEGSKSEMDACRVGVRLEDHDIADLREAQVSFPAHKEVLENLEAASNNHLRAFHRNLTARDGTYEAEALPANDFNTIVNGEMEPGACGAECGKGGKCGNQGAGQKGAKAGACGDCVGDGPGKGKGPNAGPGKGKGPGAGAGQGRGPGNGQGRQQRQGRGGPGGPNR